MKKKKNRNKRRQTIRKKYPDVRRITLARKKEKKEMRKPKEEFSPNTHISVHDGMVKVEQLVDQNVARGGVDPEFLLLVPFDNFVRDVVHCEERRSRGGI